MNKEYLIKLIIDDESKNVIRYIILKADSLEHAKTKACGIFRTDFAGYDETIISCTAIELFDGYDYLYINGASYEFR